MRRSSQLTSITTAELYDTPKDPPMHPIEFTLPSHDEDALAILRQSVENFRKMHRNVPINVTELSWATAWSDMVRVALYKDGAEVSEVGTTWVGSFVGMDALRPFSLPEISKVGGAAAFLPSAWQNGSLIGDDMLWAIPWLGDARVIFYWRDMLEQAGIDEEKAFRSFEQVEDTLARLRARGVATPWAVTTRRTSNTLYNIASWVWGAGGDFLSADGTQILIGEPEARAGMAYYYNLYRYMPQRSEPMDGIATFELFLNQEVAAIVSGPWFLKWLRARGTSPLVLSRIGASLLPGPSFVGGTNLVIWKHTTYEHEQIAAELVRYLVTSPALLDFYHHAGLVPARRDLLAQPPFGGDPHYQKIVEALEGGRPHSRITMWGLVEDRLIATLAHIWNEVRADPAQDIAALVERNIAPLAQRLTATLAGQR
jgi:multiple sugar transport system substrate-binding protein